MTQKALLQSAGDGTAVPAGYIGEIKYQEDNLTPVTTTFVTGTALLVTKGTWFVQVFGSGQGTGRTSQSVGFSTDSVSTTFSDQVPGQTIFQMAIGSDGRGFAFSTSVVTIASDTTYYVKSLSFGANSSGTGKHYIRFIRIA